MGGAAPGGIARVMEGGADTQRENLQSLFSAPIVDLCRIDPGYSDHASDVWRVRTATEDVVVRASRAIPAGTPLLGWLPHALWD